MQKQDLDHDLETMAEIKYKNISFDGLKSNDNKRTKSPLGFNKKNDEKQRNNISYSHREKKSLGEKELSKENITGIGYKSKPQNLNEINEQEKIEKLQEKENKHKHYNINLNVTNDNDDQK